MTETTADDDLETNCDEKQQIKKKVTTILLQHKSPETAKVSSDKELSDHDARSIVAHDEQYSRLLDLFIKNTKFNVYSKIICKSLFFVLSLVSMGIILYLMWKIVLYAFSSIANENTVALIVAGTVSFLTTFITIPTVITHYLFNPKEDESMTEIIKNLQQYDQAVRNFRK